MWSVWTTTCYLEIWMNEWLEKSVTKKMTQLVNLIASVCSHLAGNVHINEQFVVIINTFRGDSCTQKEFVAQPVLPWQLSNNYHSRPLHTGSFYHPVLKMHHLTLSHKWHLLDFCYQYIKKNYQTYSPYRNLTDVCKTYLINYPNWWQLKN